MMDGLGKQFLSCAALSPQQNSCRRGGCTFGLPNGLEEFVVLSHNILKGIFRLEGTQLPLCPLQLAAQTPQLRDVANHLHPSQLCALQSDHSAVPSQLSMWAAFQVPAGAVDKKHLTLSVQYPHRIRYRFQYRLRQPHPLLQIHLVSPLQFIFIVKNPVRLSTPLPEKKTACPQGQTVFSDSNGTHFLRLSAHAVYLATFSSLWALVWPLARM